MKTFPTMAGLEIRFETITNTIEDMKVKIKEKYSSKDKLLKGLDGVKKVMKEQFVGKNDFKSAILKVDKQLGEANIERTKINKAAEEQVKTVKDVKNKLADKADAKSVVQVVEKLKNYATFKDLKELY